MKSHLNLFVLTSLLMVSSFCMAQDTTAGLVASYPFNGNARDASQFDNDGKVVGAQLAPDRFGQPTNAFSFDGNNSYIEVTNSPSLQVGGNHITIAAWVAPSQLTGPGLRRTIVRKMPASGGEGGYLFALSEQGFPQFGFRSQSTNYYSQQATNFAVPVDMWTHAAVTYNGSVVRFYLNGTQTDTSNLGSSIGINDHPLVIGQLSAATNTDSFFGELDEIRIYDRALGADDIAALYAAQTNAAPVANIAVAPLTFFPGYANQFVLIPSGKTAAVTLSGLGSVDPDNDNLRYAWFERNRRFSTSPVVVRNLSPGRHRITLRVSDATAEDEATTVLDVLTLRQSVGILADMLNSADLSRLQQRNLYSILRLYAGSLQGNRLVARKAYLAAFQRRVQTQIAVTDPQLAADLVYASQIILDASRPQ